MTKKKWIPPFGPDPFSSKPIVVGVTEPPSVTITMLPRAEIAMHILAAIVSNRSTYRMQEHDVRVSVQYADALIKELEK